MNRRGFLKALTGGAVVAATSSALAVEHAVPESKPELSKLPEPLDPYHNTGDDLCETVNAMLEEIERLRVEAMARHVEASGESIRATIRLWGADDGG